MKCFSSITLHRIRPMPISILLLFSSAVFLSSIDSTAHGWIMPTAPIPKTTNRRLDKTAAFYMSEDIITTTSTPITKAAVSEEQINTMQQKLLHRFGKLPWLNQDERGQKSGVMYGTNDANSGDDSTNVFLSQWNWQLSYFEDQLTNLRIKPTTADDDLMYVADEQKGKRMYTVSMESDEYHEIRMTYLSFPGAEFFRCASYPRSSSEIPVMGMTLMQFGGGACGKNMAVMDYQPIQPNSNTQALYEYELRRIRTKIPCMNEAISHTHFDTPEERKYFTDVPLKCGWSNNNSKNDDDDESIKTAEKDYSPEFYRKELDRAHRDFVQSHVELTQRLSRSADEDNGAADVLKLHSDFDTLISAKEPTGMFLSGAFGKDIGNKLVHTVLFPFSRNEL